jgi:hypothetical protein
VPRVLRSLGLGFQETGETPFVGRRGHIGMRARGKKVAGDLAEALHAGEEGGKGEDGVGRWGRRVRGREREEARLG